MSIEDTLTTLIPEPLLIHWCELSPGAFHVGQLSKDVDRQQLYIDRLESLVKKGYLKHHGDKRGWYIPRQNELVEMDYMNANDAPVDIWLPFSLSNYVELHE